jgi:formylglycine-generating enzyme
VNDIYASVLRDIILQYGRTVCAHRDRLEALLRDMLGTKPGKHERAVKVLLLALDERVPAQLIAVENDAARDVTASRLVVRLQESLALTEEAARWAVETWSFALQVGMSPLQLGGSLRPGAAKAAPPAPAAKTHRNQAGETVRVATAAPPPAAVANRRLVRWLLGGAVVLVALCLGLVLRNFVGNDNSRGQVAAASQPSSTTTVGKSVPPATDGDPPASSAGSPSSPSFDLEVPSRVVVRAGKPSTFAIRVHGKNLSEPVVVSFGNVPQGAYFAAVAIPVGAVEAAGRIEVERTLAPGDRQVPVVASSGGATVRTTLIMAVEESRKLSVEVTPPVSKVVVGQTVRVRVKVVRDQSDAPVSLRFEDLPEGVTAERTTIAAGDDHAEVELRTSRDTPLRESTVRLVAWQDNVRGESSLRLVTQGIPHLRLQLEPSLVVHPGESKLVRVAVVRENAVGSVTVRFDGLARGITLDPVTIPEEENDVYAKVAVSADADTGQHVMHVVAERGQVRGEQDVTVRVERPDAPLAAAPFDSARAKELQELWAAHLGRPLQTTNSVGMNFVLIPPGEFMMGNGESSVSFKKDFKREVAGEEQPLHSVRITHPYYMAECEVTVGQFRKFVDDEGYETELEREQANQKETTDGDGKDGAAEKKKTFNWRHPGMKQEDDHPVVYVSWRDAQAFCSWLSRKEGKTYRLPTEAEWEHACRAGTTTRFWCGDAVDSLIGVANTHSSGTKAVGGYRANPFGLYDIHGNVAELCTDRYLPTYYRRFAEGTALDPKGPTELEVNECYEELATKTPGDDKAAPFYKLVAASIARGRYPYVSRGGSFG